ncbi:MAG: mechanosensitive ion channel [Prevotella sp.]|nr:mechanosensitive ion channel [Prevotella sp.]
MKKSYFIILFLMVVAALPSRAVLKEKDLTQTLGILRAELTKTHSEQEKNTERIAQQEERTRREFMNIWQRSNQNAMMLYSQKADYVFDLTYACHEATDQFHEFKQLSLPFRNYIEKMETELARYDSLINSLQNMPVINLDERAKIDRNVCLTYAVNIRKSMLENKLAFDEYIERYNRMEQRLSYLNDYANQRYGEIQYNIFRNGGDSYLKILRSLKRRLMSTAETVTEKYRPYRNINSQWDAKIILDLFLLIMMYGLLSILLNLLFFRYVMPKRFQTEQFKQKKSCIVMATTTITFAVILGIIHAFINQNFIIMASELLIEYAWLLGVILISLILRLEGDQIKSAFRIYAPLITMGFLVISFRIVLIPNDLVDLIFPPILLLCALWQWNEIARHSKNIPYSDTFYAYISLIIFVISTVCAWIGYTLMSVQVLLWWIMQLACILTITCLTGWMKKRSIKKHIDELPITKTWFFQLIYYVILPILGLISIPLSIFMAADVFNLSDLTWTIFKTRFIDINNFKVSIFSVLAVIALYFIFKYINKVSLAFLRLHFRRKNLVNVGSREVMGKNVIQVIVWGAWLMISLAILHVGGTWMGYIAGGLSTGIGFASKDILENIYYGISLMAGRIKVGDWIDVEGTKGKVASISYTSTMIEAIDGSVIAFTNSQMFTKNYKNLTKNHGFVLSLILFGVAYGSGIKEVCALIEERVSRLHHDYLDPEKNVKVVFTEFGDNSINFKLLCWVDAVKQIYAVSDIMECIYDTLNEHHIEIPFPQRDVYIKTLPENKTK